MQIFSRKPVRPGHWDFVWTPAHGAIDYIREHVGFDPARQLFVRDPELVPRPDLPTFLPKGARLIEHQIVTWSDPFRLLALWMDMPRYFNPPPESHSADDQLYGPRWIGLAHLSLIDLVTNRVINTIALPKDLPIPAAEYYSGTNDRSPVLELRDLTGEGVKGQFVLPNHTRAYGYSPTQDRVVQ